MVQQGQVEYNVRVLFKRSKTTLEEKQKEEAHILILISEICNPKILVVKKICRYCDQTIFFRIVILQNIVRQNY